MTHPHTEAASSTGRERYRPHRQDMRMEREQAAPNGRNVGEAERVLSGVIGGMILLRSIARRFSPKSGIAALIGIALLQRAGTGHCPAYSAMGITTEEADAAVSRRRRKIHTHHALKIEQSVTIERPAKDLYRFWRRLDNLPQVMSQVRRIEFLDDHRSHWIINTLPGAPAVEWDAEIINEVEDERIGWRTLPGASIEHAGSVQFEPVGDGRSTKVTVMLQYEPPAGPIGAAVAGLLGQDPRRKIADDLERFKQAMESDARAS